MLTLTTIKRKRKSEIAGRNGSCGDGALNSISRHFSSRDVKTLGQVFTPAKIVKKMLRLCKNDGRTLEPSSGDGAFLSRLGKDAVGIEIDGGLVDDPRVLKTDFFSYPEKNKFDTIIGNPALCQVSGH